MFRSALLVDGLWHTIYAALLQLRSCHITFCICICKATFSNPTIQMVLLTTRFRVILDCCLRCQSQILYKYTIQNVNSCHMVFNMIIICCWACSNKRKNNSNSNISNNNNFYHHYDSRAKFKVVQVLANIDKK